MPGLKLITLNTDLYYVRNFFTMLDTDQDDPSGMFHDLILELQDSEDHNERGRVSGSTWKLNSISTLRIFIDDTPSSCRRINQFGSWDIWPLLRGHCLGRR